MGSGNNNSQVVLPYISDVSDKLEHTFHQYGIRVCFKPFNILRYKLVRPKDPQPSTKKCELVYGIKCSDCDASYVGETKQALGSQLEQHRRSSANESQLSAVFSHITETGHNFDDRSVVIAMNEVWEKLSMSE